MFRINETIIKIILLIIVSAGANGDNAYVETTSDKFQKDALKHHNYYRKLHGSPPLVHDKKLEAFARKRAKEIAKKDGTNFYHPDDLQWGENLAWNSITNVDCQIPLKLWYEEWSNPGYNFKKPNITPKNGHFTQMVWKDTKKVGCGQAVSKGKKGGTYTVCNYDPPGNYIGEEIDNVKKGKKDTTPPPKKMSKPKKAVKKTTKTKPKVATKAKTVAPTKKKVIKSVTSKPKTASKTTKRKIKNLSLNDDDESDDNLKMDSPTTTSRPSRWGGRDLVRGALGRIRNRVRNRNRGRTTPKSRYSLRNPLNYFSSLENKLKDEFEDKGESKKEPRQSFRDRIKNRWGRRGSDNQDNILKNNGEHDIVKSTRMPIMQRIKNGLSNRGSDGSQNHNSGGESQTTKRPIMERIKKPFFGEKSKQPLGAASSNPGNQENDSTLKEKLTDGRQDTKKSLKDAGNSLKLAGRSLADRLKGGWGRKDANS